MQEVFRTSDFPDLLVGLSGPDDAAVWRLDDSRALVVTTDFFTPIVDDPHAYGAIAAANSLSDIYAMGGKPFLALNIIAVPENLPMDITSRILTGGAEKALEAGVVICGGHSVKDPEPKYGLVALGFTDPRRMLTKAGLRAGDVLVMTKPLGFGLTTTALKRDQAEPADVAEATEWMMKLNRTAAELALELDLTACTDITGYGLLGHGLEMARASGLQLQFDFRSIPFLGGAARYASMSAFAGGLLDNQRFFGSHIHFAASIENNQRMMLFDPQTSGGLLLGVPATKLERFRQRATESNQPIWVVGTAGPGAGISVD